MASGQHQDEITKFMFSRQVQGTKYVSLSMDGHIKFHEASNLTQFKNYFVTQDGLTAGCPMGSPDLFALASLNNNIYIFSPFTGSSS